MQYKQHLLIFMIQVILEFSYYQLLNINKSFDKCTFFTKNNKLLKYISRRVFIYKVNIFYSSKYHVIKYHLPINCFSHQLLANSTTSAQLIGIVAIVADEKVEEKQFFSHKTTEQITWHSKYHHLLICIPIHMSEWHCNFHMTK